MDDLDRVVEDKVKASLEEHKEDMLKEIGSLFEKISGNSSSKFSSMMINSEKFKRKSNEEQYKHNAKVMIKLEDAENGLQDKKLEECRANIAEAKEMMARRQKLIKLADSAELGWRVVQEYEANPLASDSDDEKRIFKAEARASKKYKAEKSKKTKSARNWPYRKQQRMFTETSPGSQQLVGRQGRRPGLCFACGKPGHWRGAPECPERNTNNKISNDLFTCVNRENIYDGCCDSNLSNSEGDVLHIPYLNEKYVEEHKICSQLRSVEENEDTVVSPVGRLKNCVNKWKEASDSAYIIQVVEKGYMLPLKEVPPSVVLRNNRSARDNIKFVEEEIERLLKKKVISRSMVKPHVVNPLTVAYKITSLQCTTLILFVYCKLE
ncbi:uncharacterized protein LOC132750954 [Ruditapes philippinarum]|uniref:uncharacterized protein LOC132750954 n=1 Tax=Ruditapes philippinarum TaxID=129788 RepID=UPI00295BC8B9|nr:uncharacterized protein LOC132750954 [Ruditapes philippinarum]